MAITSFPQVAAASGRVKKTERITSTQTWTSPADVTEIEIILCGGGSGSSRVTDRYMGGRGSVTYDVLTVTPSTSYTVTIGAGGADNSSGSNSSFGALLTCLGATTSGNKTSFGGDGGARSSDSNGGAGSGASGFQGFGGGGGGQAYRSYGAGAGSNGGGRGGWNESGGPAGSSGRANTGGGGGGGVDDKAGGSGGSGIAVISYWTAT